MCSSFRTLAGRTGKTVAWVRKELVRPYVIDVPLVRATELLEDAVDWILERAQVAGRERVARAATAARLPR